MRKHLRAFDDGICIHVCFCVSIWVCLVTLICLCVYLCVLFLFNIYKYKTLIENILRHESLKHEYIEICNRMKKERKLIKESEWDGGRDKEQIDR